MKIFRCWRDCLLFIAALIALIMAVHVAANYRALSAPDYWGGAPATIAFVWCIPYGAVILIVLALAWRAHRKGK